MTSRLAITGSVAVACLIAAGTGGYLAVRTATHTSEAAAGTAPPITGPAELAPPLSQPAARAVAVRTTPEPKAGRRTAGTPASTAESQILEGGPVMPESVAAAEAPPALDAPTSASTLPIDPGRTIALPAPRYEQVELPSNVVIGIRIETTISSETAQVEDQVEARVTRPVVIDGRTVIPTGARLTGTVTVAERGGRFHERSRIGVQFTSVTVNDGVHVPIQTEAIYRVGEAPTGEATAKIGASAVIGSILGGVFGGKKGAAIGAATGAAGGTAVVAAGGPNEATLASGSTLTVRLAESARFEVGR
jgi:hypothetical protein